MNLLVSKFDFERIQNIAATVLESGVKLDDALRDGMSVDGALGIALVDFGSGMILDIQGENSLLDLEVAGAGRTDVARANPALARRRLRRVEQAVSV